MFIYDYYSCICHILPGSLLSVTMRIQAEKVTTTVLHSQAPKKWGSNYTGVRRNSEFNNWGVKIDMGWNLRNAFKRLYSDGKNKNRFS